ncbi:Rieske (2Fe-2S) protein [Nocardioides zeae]
MTADRGIGPGIGRRGFVRAGAGAVGVAAATPVVTACAGGEVSAPSGSPGDVLVATGDVPVGGGVILDEQKIVVTQPSAGEFKAFSSTCTHRSCQVTRVEEGSIVCLCHNSLFSVEDGSVQEGPADEPLPAVDVDVAGDDVVLA